MNARTLIITAGAVVALTAPAVANAKVTPSGGSGKNAAKKHAVKPVLKAKGHSRQIYIYIPGPVTPVPSLSEAELEAQYNADLVAHGLDPVTFPDSVATAAADTTNVAAGTVTVNGPAASSSVVLDTNAIDDSDDC